MRSLFERTKQANMTIMEKFKDILHQRDDMRLQMEEAFTAKEAVSPEADLLRCLHLCCYYRNIGILTFKILFSVSLV